MFFEQFLERKACSSLLQQEEHRNSFQIYLLLVVLYLKLFALLQVLSLRVLGLYEEKFPVSALKKKSFAVKKE